MSILWMSICSDCSFEILDHVGTHNHRIRSAMIDLSIESPCRKNEIF